MATRSMIGKLNEDKKTVTAIYCHWDGYLENNGQLLTENYADANKIDQLLALGDLSVLGEEIGEKHDFDTTVENSCTAYGRDRGEEGVEAKTYSIEEYNYSDAGNKRGVSYVYLFDGKEWLYQDYSAKGWKPVSINLKLLKETAR
jgi:hypothetical protein